MIPFDILVKNVQVLDGSGSASRVADIGIRDGKFKAVQPDLPSDQVGMVIDGKGLTAAPGFIDVHTHDDLFLLRKPDADEKILQGITTVITGNCGFSAAPLVQNGREILKSFDGILGAGSAIDFFTDQVSFGEFLDMLEDNKPGLNVGALVGNLTVRIAAMQHDMRPPNENEMAHMKSLVAEAMESGAFGFSSGLEYAPGSYAQTPELIELAAVAASYGSMYTTHMRNENDNLLDSIREAIRIGEESGARVQISHLKVGGKRNWGKSSDAIELIEEARQRGLEISADQYPYTAGSTGMFALLPPDVLAGGLDSLSVRLQDPLFRKELRDRMLSPDNREGMMAMMTFDDIQIAGSSRHPEYEGKTLQQLAKKLRVDPYELVFDLIAEEKMQITIIVFVMDENDVKRIMQANFVMMGSDGLPLEGAHLHPRMCGTAPRILGRYCREQHVLKLEEAIRKMTSLPAETFRLVGKGLIKEGYDADLVLFDPDRIIDQATFENPTKPPIGIAHVFVNGMPAVENNRVLGTRAGKVLRHAA